MLGDNNPVFVLIDILGNIIILFLIAFAAATHLHNALKVKTLRLSGPTVTKASE